MNNDINGDMKKYVNTIKPGSNKAQPSSPIIPNEKEQNSDSQSVENSMDILGAMGCAQVNMNNLGNKATLQSVEQFMKNPDFVEAQVAFCDDLVKRGYNLEDAIMTTDKFFGILSMKETYS